MAFVLKNRVKETTTTTGTGAYALGGASATFDQFQDYMSNGDTTYYSIAHTAAGTDEWEVGIGTWNTGNTLSRTTVLAGSNGTSAVNFSSGTKDIFITYPAGKAVFQDSSGNVTLSGNLTVNGTTTTVNSTTVTIDDPIFTIGGDSAPGSDDNKDRGIEFRYHNGSAAKVGFFGFDDSAGKFTFIPDATNSSEVFSGTAGTIVADLEGDVTGAVTGNADTATALATARTIALSGDVTGSVSFDGSGNVDITSTIADDSHAHVISNVDGLQTALDGKAAGSVTLTAGDGLTGGGDLTSGRSFTVGAGTGVTVNANDVAIGQAVGTGDSVTFASVTVDDITINGSTISDAGAFTLDVGGNITLDADGSIIALADGGTEFAQLFQSGGGFSIYTPASDSDFKVVGNDGGSSVTALTLDMSDAGTATFNSRISGGGLSASSYFADADDLVLGGTGHQGITIASGTSSDGNIFFADGTSSDARYRGIVRYSHADDAMKFYTSGANERFRVGSSGQLGIGGATYGSSGQVLTSGGASAAPSWTTIETSGVPSGGIIMWSGTNGDIPSGFVLCDGNNSTPNLTDRFIIGRGGSTNTNSTGGANTVTLSTNNLPSHSHGIGNIATAGAGSHSHSADGNLATDSSGNHTHGDGNYATSNSGNHTHGDGNLSAAAGGDHSHNFNANTGNSGSHSHNGSTSNTGSHNHSGNYAFNNGSNNNLFFSSHLGQSGYIRTFNNINSSGNHSHNLSTNNAGSHSHNFNTNTGNSGNHTHNVSGNTGGAGDHSHNVTGNSGGAGDHSHDVTGNTSNVGNHTHTMSGNTGNAGSGSALTITPIYFTLAFIMKT